MPGLNVKVYECSVTGVRVNDRLVDVLSAGGVTFKKCSYLLPWITGAGAGIDVIPKTGDRCMVLATSDEGKGDGGRVPVVIGFRVPSALGSGGKELAGRRENLPQGSICLRAGLESGEEGCVLLTPGGSVLVSANEICRTLYSPVDCSVVTLFNSWELIGPGGFVKWIRESGSEAISYHASYSNNTALANGTAEDSQPGDMTVDVKIGGEQEDLIDIQMTPNLESNPYFRLRVSTDGEVFIEGESITIDGRAALTLKSPNLTIKNRQVLGQTDPI